MYIIKSEDESVKNFAVVLDSETKMEDANVFLSSQINFLEIELFEKYVKDNPNVKVVKVRKGIKSFDVPTAKIAKAKICAEINIVTCKIGKMMMLGKSKVEGDK